jgi:hypothetical protein
VAVLGSAFAAEECQSVAIPVGGLDAAYASLEHRVSTASVIVDMAVLVIALGIVWTATQGVAEEHVSDVLASQNSIQWLARELGSPP